MTKTFATDRVTKLRRLAQGFGHVSLGNDADQCTPRLSGINCPHGLGQPGWALKPAAGNFKLWAEPGVHNCPTRTQTAQLGQSNPRQGVSSCGLHRGSTQAAATLRSMRMTRANLKATEPSDSPSPAIIGQCGGNGQATGWAAQASVLTPPPHRHRTQAVAGTASPIRIRAGRRQRLQVCTS